MWNNSLENIHDTYGTMLYSAAVEIAPTKQQAEEILITTFRKIHQQNLIRQTYTPLSVTLIKLLIQTAHEQLKPEELKHKFEVKPFESAPLLHQLLCKKIDFNCHSVEDNSAQVNDGKILREEFNLLRKSKNREQNISGIFPGPLNGLRNSLSAVVRSYRNYNTVGKDTNPERV